MDIINIFQTLAFPVAICVVLIIIVIALFKEIKKIQERFIEYLQKKDSQSNQLIQENTKAVNRFSAMMVKIADIVHKYENLSNQ